MDYKIFLWDFPLGRAGRRVLAHGQACVIRVAGKNDKTSFFRTVAMDKWGQTPLLLNALEAKAKKMASFLSCLTPLFL